MLLDAIAIGICAACYGLARSASPRKPRRGRRSHRIVLGLALALSAGCYSPTEPVEPSDAPLDTEPWIVETGEAQ